MYYSHEGSDLGRLLCTDLVLIIHVHQEPRLPRLLESPALLLLGPPANQEGHLRIMEDNPRGSGRPHHLRACGGGVWLRGMCTLSTPTVGSLGPSVVPTFVRAGPTFYSIILPFYYFKASILS